MLFLLLYTLLTYSLAFAQCAVQLAFPLDEQLPRVARVGKPFKWSFSDRTFTGLPAEPINYSASNLPGWLSFNSQERRFSGTPDSTNAANTKIIVTASQAGTSADSSFILCVVTSSEPVVDLPLSSQLATPRASLSSVFNLRERSALETGNPALRIPPRWSFSIGFELETLHCDDDVFYDVRQRDGSYLPSWMTFSFKELTLNGVVPNETIISQPTTFPLNLYASDVEGYSAEVLPFDIVIALHEVSTSTSPLPAIAVPLSAGFQISLNDSLDFSSIQVDGTPIKREEISDVYIDTAGFTGLHYDHSRRTLSGDWPQETHGGNLTLPIIIATIYHQEIQTALSLSNVPSIFVNSDLPSLETSLGGFIDFNLRKFILTDTDVGHVDVTATFDPPDCSHWLEYNADSSRLTGHVPTDFSGGRVQVTFTAYSRDTRSSYRTQLPILLSSGHVNNGVAKSSSHKMSAGSRHTLVLALSISFGLMGGFCLLGVFLAIVRRCSRVPDTAVLTEEGQNAAWNENEKKWYGISSVSQMYGPFWIVKKEPDIESKDKGSEASLVPASPSLLYETHDLGLRRVSERSQAAAGNLTDLSLQSPGVMSKKDFKRRIQQTIRIVSDRARGRVVSRERPVISRPMLGSVRQTANSDLLVEAGSFNEVAPSGLLSTPASTVLTQSPSASTGEHSIPVRRPDFSAPRRPRRAATNRHTLIRQNSTESTISTISENSVKTHAAEAIVQIASRTTSVSGSLEQPRVARPRLVPFSGASRVPIPVGPSDTPETLTGASTIRRVPSQKAAVYRKDDPVPKFATPDAKGDWLSKPSSSPTPQRTTPAKDKMTTRVRPGEAFRLPIRLLPLDPAAKEKSFLIKLVNGTGRSVPSFMKLDTTSLTTRGIVELKGTPPSKEAAGTYVVGVCGEDGECLVTVTVEVQNWR